MISTDERVLVVDDDNGLRNLITLICRRAGFTVDSANDGASALKLMETHRYLLVTLDLQMPQINGFDVVARLAKQKDRPAIIVITAMPASTYLGLDPKVVQAVIRKPFDVDLLSGIVTEVATHARAAFANPDNADDTGDNVITFPR
jgi:DNA-binding response OmpR family regulator